ncbi:MAG TPA: PAS domain S-box protein [Mucilaginibacter sp.]|nr:PAS domain S-box protein [Mucilaginibacter sp.]
MTTKKTSLYSTGFIDPGEDFLQLSLVASENDNGVVFNDAYGRIFWANESFCKLIGYTAEEIIGRQSLDFCRGPLTPQKIIDDVAKAIGKKKSFTEELIHYRKDGSWFWGRVKGKLYQSRDGQYRCFSIVEDITIEKQKEEKLEVLSKIAEDNINAVILTDREGHITWVNKSFTKITGYTLEEAVNNKPGHLLQGPETDKKTVAYLKKQISAGQPFNTEIVNYSKSGKPYWLRIQGQPIRNSGGELTGFFALEEDITSEKKIQEQLKESEARFRLALEKIGDNVWEHNFKTNKTIFSKTNKESGYVSHRFGDNDIFWWDVVSKRDVQRLKQTYAKYLKGEIDSHNLEYQVISENGSKKCILDRGAVIEYDAHGKPLRITGTHTDITKIKQTETQLEQRVKQFQSLSENIPGVVYEYEYRSDGSHGFRYIGPNMHRVFGIKPDDFINCLFNLPAEDSNRIREKNEHSRSTLEPFYDEIFLTMPEVGARWYSAHSSFSYFSERGATVFTGFLQDITERKTLEEKLKSREEKYRSIIANMKLGLLEVDLNEKITFANNSFCEMSGYTQDDLLNNSARLLFTKEKSVELLEKKMALRATGVADAYQLQIHDKKGEKKWWLVSGAPNYNDKGRLIGSIGIHLDITEQKKQEEELIEARVQAEHLAQTQEIFLANMSHEIRTPMNAIMGMSGQLSKTSLQPQQRFYLDVIHSASENLLVIINDILDLSKIEAGKLNIENIGFEPLNSAKRVVQVLAHKAEEKGLRLVNSYFDENISPVLIGDPYRLNQIMLNLMTNAVKFTEAGTVDLAFKLIRDNGVSQLIQIEVEDTGIGMEESFVNHLFDKFSQESKSVSRIYGGTGLGMSICKDLVELMGGEIAVKSKRNSGTLITVKIEFKKGRVEDLPEKANLQFNTGFLSGKKVLITDDNELNRLVALIMLQNYGADVTEAVNGNAAIEMVDKQNFDVILMDIQMPGMNGFDATRIIRKKGIKYPIIALTAEAIKGEREKCIAAGMDDYVTKPIDEAVFLKTLDRWVKSGHQFDNKSAVVMTTEKLYDLSSLKAISKGNEMFVQKMVNIFCEQTPMMLDEMGKALAESNWEKLARTAHQIKPSIDNLHINSLTQLIRDVESSAKEVTATEDLPEKLDILKQTITLVISKLRVTYPE